MQLTRMCVVLAMVVGCNSAEQAVERADEKAFFERTHAAEAAKAAMAAKQGVEIAKAELEKAQADLAAADVRIAAAVDAVAAAQTQADRAAAKVALEDLRGEQQQLASTVAAKQAALARAERKQGISIAPACLENPLAKGCM